jgi:hypothetical protein
MWTTSMFSDDETVRFAEANNLKDVRWVATTAWGILVGFQNGTSRIVGEPASPARPWPLKRKYRP